MRNVFVSVLLIPLTIAVTALPAQATQGLYFDASLGFLSGGVDGGEDFSTQNAFIKVGKKLSPALSVEGLLGLGIGSDKWSSACDSQEVSTDNFVGAQAVGSVPLSPEINFHGTIGLMLTTASIKMSGAASCYGLGWSETYSDTETGLSYGVGIDYQLSKKSAVTANYQIFYNDSYSGVDVTIGGFLIGYKQNF